jgi:hypothetical protein
MQAMASFAPQKTILQRTKGLRVLRKDDVRCPRKHRAGREDTA